eukprot:CAMPEP_0184544510 /NCGR_PEP_ID=MMETSP0199_2-20130426/3669_1 /TAXON_ID=1112570 /ORGANISM="Thraustochytrium sp., Strain LLF1b" /LENGTH=449 /DNA_ID=CAMNT_0026938693 /DNA_START=29 /DNA_END=1378 /DNA_ORIENTATION=-
MIVYDNKDPTIVLRVVGSAVLNWRTILPGLVSMVVAVLADKFARDFFALKFQSPTVYFNGVAFLISFVVVFRSQLAYGRFFSALNSYNRMKVRLLDLAIQTKSFAVNNDSESIRLKTAVFRWVRLYHKLALTELKGEYVDDIYVRNIVKADEMEILMACRSRALIVSTWITRALSEKISILSVPPPIAGRLFQLVSEVDLELEQAMLVNVPFPFPYAQLASMLLIVWCLVTPLFISRFMPDAAFYSGALSFLATWVLFGVNESAAQLESPFGDDDNDIPLTLFDTLFDDLLSTTQFTRDPSFFNSQIHAASRAEVARQRESIQRRGMNMGEIVAASGVNINFSKSSKVFTVIEDDSESATSGGSRGSQGSDFSEEDYDIRFVPEESARVLFHYTPDKKSSSCRDTFPRWLCHNPISRLFAKSRRSLREVIFANVNVKTLQAEGKFRKFT